MTAPRAPRSLRARLLLAGVIGALLAAFAGAAAIGAAYERAVEDSVARRLESELATLVGLAETDPQGAWSLRGEPDAARHARIFSGHYWLVQGAGHEARSRSLWDATLDLPDARTRVSRAIVDGPRDQSLLVVQQAVRLPRTDAPIRFAVAEDRAAIVAETRQFRTLVTLAQLGLGLLLVALAVAQVHYGLRPLGAVSARLADVRTGRRERIALDDLPTEVAPLAHEIDALLVAHEANVARVRRSTADLAHALKTPLAVLAAAASRPSDDWPRHVATEVARMRRVIERRLAAAAADPRQRTALAPVAARIVDGLRRAHAARGVDVVLEPGDDALRVVGAPDDVEEMLGNLVDNACKWARSTVRVAVEGACVTVEDDGPGIAADAIAVALARGGRLDERVEGSGLGLSIVAELAEAYGATLAIDRSPALGGARVRLSLATAGSG